MVNGNVPPSPFDVLARVLHRLIMTPVKWDIQSLLMESFSVAKMLSPFGSASVVQLTLIPLESTNVYCGIRQTLLALFLLPIQL
jgi:hypothetical protein